MTDAATRATALAALRRETERAGAFLASLEPTEWSRPTRCPPLTVIQLAAHALRGGMRINEMLDAGPIETEPEKDGATYFGFDAASFGPGVVQRAIEAAGTLDPTTAARTWNEVWSSVLARAEPDLAADDRVYRSILGTMRLSEYLRTRVVEVTIHGMDLRDALGRDPDPAPEALEVACDVLRELLGVDTRRLGIDEVHFALAGTGRSALTDADRAALGPLVERFPLLA